MSQKHCRVLWLQQQTHNAKIAPYLLFCSTLWIWGRLLKQLPATTSQPTTTAAALTHAGPAAASTATGAAAAEHTGLPRNFRWR